MDTLIGFFVLMVVGGMVLSVWIVGKLIKLAVRGKGFGKAVGIFLLLVLFAALVNTCEERTALPPRSESDRWASLILIAKGASPFTTPSANRLVRSSMTVYIRSVWPAKAADPGAHIYTGPQLKGWEQHQSHRPISPVAMSGYSRWKLMEIIYESAEKVARRG